MGHSNRRTTCAALALLLLAVVAAGRPAVRGVQSAQPRPGTADALLATIADVEAGGATTPIVGGQNVTGEFVVTFLARSRSGEVPRVVSDVTGWGENIADDTFDFTIGRMTRVGGTAWYSLDARVAPRARVEYLLVHGRDYQVDPHNPRLARFRAAGPASEFVTPGYVPPDDLARLPPVPAGSTAQVAIASRALRGSRRVIVYTPPGYTPSQRYPAAVFHHGVSPSRGRNASEARGRTAAPPAIEPDVPPRLLDQMIARHIIQPVVAVFVESQPFGDARGYPPGAIQTFLAREVPAWLTAHFAVAADANGRAILAVSYGAKDALDAATDSADGYRRLGLLIPGRRIARESKLEELAARRSARLRVAILAGRYDHANRPTALSVRQALESANHHVDYVEVAEGHTPATWRDHMPEVLAALFPPVRDER